MYVIIPTDFSKNARKAIDFVYRNVDFNQTRVELVHCVKTPASTSSVLIRVEDLMKKDAETNMILELEYIIDKYAHKPHHTIRIGYLEELVGKVPGDAHDKIMVMGTKGETGLADKLFGTVTEAIIRHSEIPILVVPDNYSEQQVKRVVIACENPQLKLEREVSLLQEFDLMQPEIVGLYIDTQNNVSGLPKSHEFEGYQVNMDVEVNNSVVDGINNYIEKNKTDLLVLTQRHKSVIDYLFNRSTTKQLCADTKIPLLIFPNRK